RGWAAAPMPNSSSRTARGKLDASVKRIGHFTPGPARCVKWGGQSGWPLGWQPERGWLENGQGDQFFQVLFSKGLVAASCPVSHGARFAARATGAGCAFYSSRAKRFLVLNASGEVALNVFFPPCSGPTCPLPRSV